MCNPEPEKQRIGLLDSIFGGNAKRRDIAQANRLAQQRRAQGLGRFRSVTRDGLGEATAPLREGATAGASGLNRFAAATGALGREAQQSFFDDFADDPGFRAEQNEAQRGLLRARNAAGSLNSGATREALVRQSALLRRGATENRLASLLQLARLGQTDRTNIARITDNAFQRLARAEFDTGERDASALEAQGRAFAGTRGQLNDLFRLLIDGARAVR